MEFCRTEEQLLLWLYEQRKGAPILVDQVCENADFLKTSDKLKWKMLGTKEYVYLGVKSLEHVRQNLNDLKAIVALQKEKEQLQEELGFVDISDKDLDIKAEKELKGYIDLLHKYNETRDLAVDLLGKLAEIEGKTMKDLYEEYGVEDIDKEV
ncbi:hypothetical protein MP638_001717 [Amoeboaphelidium occidentale]|nr:hypothetical protein MP638_001717 [Amoeboaphelidium occidentale]